MSRTFGAAFPQADSATESVINERTVAQRRFSFPSIQFVGWAPPTNTNVSIPRERLAAQKFWWAMPTLLLAHCFGGKSNVEAR